MQPLLDFLRFGYIVLIPTSLLSTISTMNNIHYVRNVVLYGLFMACHGYKCHTKATDDDNIVHDYACNLRIYDKCRYTLGGAIVTEYNLAAFVSGLKYVFDIRKCVITDFESHTPCLWVFHISSCRTLLVSALILIEYVLIWNVLI